MAQRIGFTILTILSFAGVAHAGEVPPPVPLPLAGVSGPVGLIVGAAAYSAYRVYKYYGQKGK